MDNKSLTNLKYFSVKWIALLGLLKILVGNVYAVNHNPAGPPLDPDISRSVPSVDYGSGSKYRKIGLNGLPLPDEKPQAKEETDGLNEETFIDGFSHNFNHGTSDVYIPVPNSDLVATVRRDTTSESWTSLDTKGPYSNKLVAPFGLGWTSNIGGHVRFTNTVNTVRDSNGIITSRSFTSYIYVIDEQGAQHRFIALPGEENDLPSFAVPPTFSPFPTTIQQYETYQTQLVSTGGAVDATTGAYQVEGLKFIKKYGTECTYEYLRGEFEYRERDRIIEGQRSTESTRISHRLYRLTRATDRFGSFLEFNFAGSPGSIIPNQIRINGSSTQKITISQTGELVRSVTDPRGNVTEYSYSKTADGYDTLTKVKKPAIPGLAGSGEVVPTVEYTYESKQQTPISRLSGKLDIPAFNYLALDSLTQTSQGGGLKKTYEIDYVIDESVFEVRTLGSDTAVLPVRGRPLRVTRITQPDLSQTAFEVISLPLQPFSIGSTSSRVTKVTDSEGHSRKYTFSGAYLLEVSEMRSEFSTGESTSVISPSLLIIFERMRIDSIHSNGSFVGYEELVFDYAESFAPKKITPFTPSGGSPSSGTSFVYGNALPTADILGTPIFRVAGFSIDGTETLARNSNDPTQQTDALGNTKNFTYESRYNLMETIIDEEGRKTEYTIDSLGRRTAEKIFDASMNLVQQTDFDYHPTYRNFMISKKIKTLSGDPDWAENLTTMYEPDSMGRISKMAVDMNGNGIIDDGLDLVTSYTYDLNNNKLSIIDPRGNTTNFEYDALNRLVQTTFPSTDNGNSRAFKINLYDQFGNIVTKIDENGHSTVLEYDNFNRLTRSTRLVPSSGNLVTQYTYNFAN